MKCERCGHETDSLSVLTFDRFGSDYWDEVILEEAENSAVLAETSRNWTGYELSEEEMKDTIRCPYCKKWPFKSDEIQIFEPVLLVMFKSEKED